MNRNLFQIVKLDKKWFICEVFSELSENPTNHDRSRYVDVKVHFLRDLVHDGHVNLLKCVGTQNVSDDLTKSLSRPTFEKHREYMIGTRVPFSVFYTGMVKLDMSITTYVIKFPTPFYSKKDPTTYCVVRNVS